MILLNAPLSSGVSHLADAHSGFADVKPALFRASLTSVIKKAAGRNLSVFAMISVFFTPSQHTYPTFSSVFLSTLIKAGLLLQTVQLLPFRNILIFVASLKNFIFSSGRFYFL